MGSLFYPCCGSDIDHAMSAFGPYVLDCHFADPYQTVRNRSRRARNLKKISVPGVEDVVVGGAGGERIDNAACVAYSHAKDGLLTLIEDIGALSVFYYRGDSGGEGGSNQRWLGPILFHTVLARLLDGGLIATDGSNCGAAHEGQQVLWAPICAPSTAEPAPFVYAHREFRYVGELTDQDPDRPRRKLVRLWQVRSEQKRV
jgi:hypothetical protein